MLFKKHTKMAVTTFPFVNSLLLPRYYVENTVEYDFNGLINKIWIRWPM